MTAPRQTGRSSGRPRPTRTSAERFVLSGPSNPPDPQSNAYRRDLADIGLADRVIASHYVEPAKVKIVARATLRAAPSDEGGAIRELAPGEPFWMLDARSGWTWGYAGTNRRVGYVRSEALDRV